MKKDKVAGIIIKDGRVLLMFRRNHGKEYYTFPGGGIERGETVEAAVIREVKEETSTEVRPIKMVYSVCWDNEYHQYFYLCSYISGEAVLGNFIEKEVMTADKNQYYEPMWLATGDLKDNIVYPLEIRDQFIEDLTKSSSNIYRELSLNLATCRQK